MTAGDLGILFTLNAGDQLFVRLTDLVDTYTAEEIDEPLEGTEAAAQSGGVAAARELSEPPKIQYAGTLFHL